MLFYTSLTGQRLPKSGASAYAVAFTGMTYFIIQHSSLAFHAKSYLFAGKMGYKLCVFLNQTAPIFHSVHSSWCDLCTASLRKVMNYYTL